VRVDFAAFWLHKDGGDPRHYEDAFAPSAVDARARTQFRCAVADGATESAFSRMWARQLVGEFAGGRLTAPDLAELPLLGQRWARAVAHAVARDEGSAWFLEPKAADGAFAALVGLDLRNSARRDDAGTYRAVALGDSCLVHVRGDRVVRAFPLGVSTAFSARPVLLPSCPAAADGFAAAIVRDAGTWQSGDAFYLMSDALACWFLAVTERGERPWRTIDRFAQADRAGFRAWVQTLRSAALKNDDVTLLRIVVR
jgi:hypothetical protein